MSTTRPPPDLARRNFLKGATLAGAATLASPTRLQAQLRHASPTATAMVRPNLVAETMPPSNDPVTQTSSGGDFMVDVLKTLNIDYCAINPASSFRGIQEAIINYGKNTKPELITCPHEEIAVSMAQGYAKMDGRPMAVLAHGTVGLQHATMGLYNAFCDRVPVYVLIGNIVDAEKRMPGVEWAHSAIDPAALVRDFVKWDDQPASLQHFAESAVRAYKIATTPPMAPEAARLLVKAENPVILCDRVVRTAAGLDRLLELAETLQCAVIDLGGRMNFPSRHPLNQSFRRPAVIGQADVIFGIELNDYYGAVHGFSDRIIRHSSPMFRPNVRTMSLGVRDLYTKANYQEFQRYADVDLAITGDGEATLPALVEAVKRRVDAGRAAVYEARGKALAAAHLALVGAAKSEATIGWDASPITTARLCAELWAQIRHEDWSLVGNGIRMLWPQRLWDFDASYRWNGFSGGAGVGYNAPASAGAALANKKHGRLSVSIQGDGDMMFAPGSLWTAAHHHIPILYVMHNNRAYHQEYMYVQAMANRHARGINNAHIGTTLTDPNIDFATVAKGFGVYGQGPITDPKDLGPALERAIAVVKRGEPALVDVVTEPR
jgi:acetolactate synthase I/II/III large subunit